MGLYSRWPNATLPPPPPPTVTNSIVGGGLGYRVTASLAPHVLVDDIVHVECTGPVPADGQLHPGRRASDAGQGPSEL